MIDSVTGVESTVRPESSVTMPSGCTIFTFTPLELTLPESIRRLPFASPLPVANNDTPSSIETGGHRQGE